MGRLPDRGEAGTVLVMALVFVLLLSLAIGALISFADAGTRTTEGVRSQRYGSYAADGAIETQIKKLQPSNGDCTQSLTSVTLPGVTGNPTVALTCQETGSGSGAPNNSQNTPGRAILTLSTDTAETGFLQGSNNVIKIHGGVFSNTNISVQSSSTVSVNPGNVRARTGCTGGTLTVNTAAGFTKDCAFSGADPTGVDPGYPASVSTRPATQTVPACTNGNHTVQMLPGTYTNAAALNALSGCDNNLIWFTPGTYYFEFSAANPIWTIGSGDKGIQFVGGTPRGWVYAGANARPTTPLPGSCKTPTDAVPNDGVQFIFGGLSQMRLSKGQIEVCAQPSLVQQQIAIFGLPNNTGSMLGEQGTCVGNHPYPSGTACALLSMTGNNNFLYVQGTVYAPKAVIDLQTPNAAVAQLFGRGIIARAFQISIQPSSGFTGDLISVPDIDTSTGSNPYREVVLTASVGGHVALRAKMHFENGSTPSLTIRDWSVIR